MVSIFGGVELVVLVVVAVVQPLQRVLVAAGETLARAQTALVGGVLFQTRGLLVQLAFLEKIHEHLLLARRVVFAAGRGAGGGRALLRREGGAPVIGGGGLRGVQ